MGDKDQEIQELKDRLNKIEAEITFWQSLRNGPSGQIVKVKCF